MNPDLKVFLALGLVSLFVLILVVLNPVKPASKRDRNTESENDVTEDSDLISSLVDLVRHLVLERIACSFEHGSRELYQAILQARMLSEEVLLGTPEATVVVIVGRHDLETKSGKARDEILREIEEERGDTTEDFDASGSLHSYLEYRVKLEHEQEGQDFSPFIAAWFAISREYFSEPNAGRISLDVLHRRFLLLTGNVDLSKIGQPMPEELLQATKLCLAAMETSVQFMQEGKYAEALTVLTHFKKHEAFAHASPANQRQLESAISRIKNLVRDPDI